MAPFTTLYAKHQSPHNKRSLRRSIRQLRRELSRTESALSALGRPGAEQREDVFQHARGTIDTLQELCGEVGQKLTLGDARFE